MSKNGNLLLSVPVRGDGTIDADERAIVESIAGWMQVNGESIFGTRPWRVFGEGPAQESAAALSAQGFNEGKGRPYGAQDIRYTAKGNVLYAIALGWPADGRLVLKSLAAAGPLSQAQVGRVELLGSAGPLAFAPTAEGLAVTLPAQKPNDLAYALRLTPR